MATGISHPRNIENFRHFTLQKALELQEKGIQVYRGASATTLACRNFPHLKLGKRTTVQKALAAVKEWLAKPENAPVPEGIKTIEPA